MTININNGQISQISSSFDAMPGFRINEDIAVTGAPTGLATVEYNWYNANIIIDDPLETVTMTVLGVTDTSSATVSYNNSVIGTINYSNRKVEVKCGGKKMRTDLVIEAGLPIAIYYPEFPEELNNLLRSNVTGNLAMKCYEKVMKGRVILVPYTKTIII